MSFVMGEIALGHDLIRLLRFTSVSFHHCSILITVKVNQSHYRPEVPRGFQEVKVPRFRDKAQDGDRLSTSRTGRLYPQEIFLVLFSVRR